MELSFLVGPSSRVMKLGLFLLVCISSFCIHCTDAYDSFDPEGKISIKWDVRSWTPDGYTADVTILNLQKYRHIEAPGWTLGWTWARREVIWTMSGALATDQGDCSRFKGDIIPHCCKKNPSIVDLLPGTVPYNKQVPNCCKGGVLSSQMQMDDPSMAASSFRLSVGQTGTTNTTVHKPENFTLITPGMGYTCGKTEAVEPSKFPSDDPRRATQALMTWNATCTYSQYLAQQTPSCCVSLSAFYSKTITLCKTCSCGCRRNSNQPADCIEQGTDSTHITSALSSSSKNSLAPVVLCTSHMCPIRVHWHILENYKEYWRVKITISNFNYRSNYSQWNLVMQHPNFNDVAQIFSFRFKPLEVYPTINDTGLLYGIEYFNEMLENHNLSGNVQSELLFRKNKSTFTFQQGWGFPREVYFNGDSCVMPSPESYPFLPNSGVRAELNRIIRMILLLVLASVLV